MLLQSNVVSLLANSGRSAQVTLAHLYTATSISAMGPTLPGCRRKASYDAPVRRLTMNNMKLVYYL